MADVVLLYATDCPNVREARTNLLHAFTCAGVSPAWRELDLHADETPETWRRLGSPTVLVDGRDVAGAEAGAGASCRVYEGLARAPDVETIAARLRASPPTRAIEPPASPPRNAARLSVTALPGIVLALLPKGMCPACWPAYAAVLSSLGVGFLMEDHYLLPITIAALTLATAAMGYRARVRRGYLPAIVAATSGAALVVGKFAFDLPNGFAYAMVSIFTIAAIWNAWPARRRAACAACLPTARAAG